MWIKWSGRYIPLKEGITAAERSYDPGGVPQKYERREQFELWPIPPSNEYTIRTEYIKTLQPLNLDTHRTSLPSEIIYLHALSNAKTHYRQPDAATYASQLDALMTRLKAKHRSRSVWGMERTMTPYDYPPTPDQQV